MIFQVSSPLDKNSLRVWFRGEISVSQESTTLQYVCPKDIASITSIKKVPSGNPSKRYSPFLCSVTPGLNSGVTPKKNVCLLFKKGVPCILRNWGSSVLQSKFDEFPIQYFPMVPSPPTPPGHFLGFIQELLHLPTAEGIQG